MKRISSLLILFASLTTILAQTEPSPTAGGGGGSSVSTPAVPEIKPPASPDSELAIENIGASLESVQTLKALVIEQVNFYEVGVGGPSVLGSNQEKMRASGRYIPETELGPNLAELSAQVASRNLVVSVSNPDDEISVYVNYFNAPLGETGRRDQLFYGGQPFKLVATKDGYRFPGDLIVQMKMVPDPVIRLPGVQLDSVRILERSDAGQITDVQYLQIDWVGSVPQFRLPAFYVEGERRGEISFQYWKGGVMQARVFDLATGKPAEISQAGGRVHTAIDGTVIIQDNDIMLVLPEGGRAPLIQWIITIPGQQYRVGIQGIVSGVPEISRAFKERPIGGDWRERSYAPKDVGLVRPEPGVYWIIPLFERYGRNVTPEFFKPEPPHPGEGKG